MVYRLVQRAWCCDEDHGVEGKRGADGGILRGLGALLVWVTQDVDLALSAPSSRTGAFGCWGGINRRR